LEYSGDWAINSSLKAVQSNAFSGIVSLKYFRNGPEAGAFSYDALLPQTQPGDTAFLSFQLSCTQTADFSLAIKVNGEQKKKLAYSTALCDTTYHRHVVDLSGMPAGNIKIEFEGQKTSSGSTQYYLDDLAVVLNQCVTGSPCGSFYLDGSNRCQMQGQPSQGYCFIKNACYADNDKKITSDCFVCKSNVKKTDWSADDSLCTPPAFCDFLTGKCK